MNMRYDWPLLLLTHPLWCRLPSSRPPSAPPPTTIAIYYKSAIKKSVCALMWNAHRSSAVHHQMHPTALSTSTDCFLLLLPTAIWVKKKKVVVGILYFWSLMFPGRCWGDFECGLIVGSQRSEKAKNCHLQRPFWCWYHTFDGWQSWDLSRPSRPAVV